MVASGRGGERDPLSDVLQETVMPFDDGAKQLDPLLDLVGNARFVLIGEASHGTHEFYKIRADLTKRLLREKGFHAVVAEADWPDAWRVNRLVQGFTDDGSANEALGGFGRFPQWMWRNADVLDFVGWLREFNDSAGWRDARNKVGFYGMDLYSLHASARAVLAYLARADPAAAARARHRYSCFDHAGEDPQAYGYAAAFELNPSCEDAAVDQLIELRGKACAYAKRDGREGTDEAFAAEVNALVVKNAEHYYRQMFGGRVNTWNLRDRHMVETVDLLTKHLDGRVGRAKVVLWAHNSHLGDARATEVSDAGELNVAQLLRENHPGATVNVGFSTYCGTVTAADDWDEPARRMRVRPALRDSYECAFHDVGYERCLLNLREVAASNPELAEQLGEERLQRAIGVIYRPQTERVSHYFRARLVEQFDAMIHVEDTRAVEPLERLGRVDAEVPETYPAGV